MFERIVKTAMDVVTALEAVKVESTAATWAGYHCPVDSEL